MEVDQPGQDHRIREPEHLARGPLDPRARLRDPLPDDGDGARAVPLPRRTDHPPRMDHEIERDGRAGRAGLTHPRGSNAFRRDGLHG